VPVLEQQFFGARPRPRQRGFEALGDGGAQIVLAPGVALGERLELGENRLGIDQVAAGAVRALSVQHVIGLAEQAHGVIVISGGRIVMSRLKAKYSLS
jgi:hypothetical protein